jgi:hypothetical protein
MRYASGYCALRSKKEKRNVDLAHSAHHCDPAPGRRSTGMAIQLGMGLLPERRARPGSADIDHPVADGSHLGLRRSRAALKPVIVVSRRHCAAHGDLARPRRSITPTTPSGATRAARTKARQRAARRPSQRPPAVADRRSPSTRPHPPRRMLRPRLGWNLDRVRTRMRRPRLDRNFDRRIGRVLVRIGTRARGRRRSRRRVQVAAEARVHATGPFTAPDLPGLRRRRRKTHLPCRRAPSDERPFPRRCSLRSGRHAVLCRHSTRLPRLQDRVRSGCDAESARSAR